MADTKTVKLEVLMAAVDRLTGPLNAMVGNSQRMVDSMKAARQAVKDLEDQQKKLDKFTKARTSAHEARDAYNKQKEALVDLNKKYEESRKKQADMIGTMKNARAEHKALMAAFANNDATPGLSNKLYVAKQNLEKLEAQYGKVQSATKSYKGEITSATQALERAKDAKHNWHEALVRTRKALREVGGDTHKLTAFQEQLKAKTAEATAAAEKQGKVMERMHAARANYEKSMAMRGKALSAGITAGATGGAIVWGLDKTVHQAAEYQKEVLKIKALGMGDHVTQDADKFARGMKVYGTSMLENVDMMRDGLTIFADLHHAEMALPVMQKMKFANQALYGEAAGNEKSQQLYDMLKVVELRGGAKDATTFKAEAELIQKVMSSTGGRVGSKDYKELIQTGGVSAKQLSTDVFYNVLEPMIQEMGGHQVGTGLQSAFQNLYLGKSTTASARTLGDLGLLKENMVEYDKIGQIKRMKTGAIVGSETYKTNPFQWLETHFLPALAKKGITDPSQVRDMLATVVGNRTGAKVLTTYLDQKDQINRSADRNRGAFGIDQTYDTAKESADGKKIALHKRFEDVQMLIGERLLPVYNKLLDLLTWVTDAVGNFAEKHPTLVTMLGYTAAAVGGLLLVFGGLAVAVAAVLGPFAMARLAMTTLGISGFTLGGAMGTVLGVLKGIALFLITNPIGLLITGIALVAGLIWANWETLGPKFWALWDGIKKYASVAWEMIVKVHVDAFNSVITFFSGLPAKFSSIGGQIMDGLVSGFIGGHVVLKNAINSVGESAIAWMKEKFGIKSPSRVFAEIGGHLMGGLTMGIDGGEDGPLTRIKAITDKLKTAGAGIALGMGAAGATAAPITIDTRPPITASAMAANQLAAAAPNITITVNAAPGMDEAALARLVAAEIEKATRQNQAALRSRLRDLD